MSSSENERANQFLSSATFPWFQRFRLAGDVFSPGPSNIPWLLDTCGLRDEFKGKTVLDVGTSNGGLAFEAERAGASRVLAVDVLTVEEYGFGAVRDFLGSDVEYLRASIYELPDLTKERFDIVAFWGVLYHLRHPLLGIDSVATMARDIISIETVIADGMLPRRHRSRATSMFFRQNELNDDYTSWFAPTITCLEDWLLSAGLHSIRLDGKWPLTKPTRCLVTARKSGDQPEFERTSNERLLHVRDVQCGDDFPQMRSKHGEADIVES